MASVRRLAALAAALALVAGCSHASLPESTPGSPAGSVAGSAEDGAEDGADVSSGDSPTGAKVGSLAEGTCWSADLLGADPQDVLELASTYKVPYHLAARAVASRPAFAHGLGCAKKHTVEVYKVVRLPKLDARLADYGALLRERTSLYGTVARSVAEACMTTPLASAVARSGLPSAVMAPALPDGATLGWAPAAPGQWAAGRRVFACTLTWDHPRSTRYSTVFTRQFPVSERTCIDSRVLEFVDCARRHDRERIAVIEAREAVAAGRFPGPKAIRGGPSGRHLAVSDARYRKLDAACTAYLRAISTTTRLTGVANVDVDEWPAPGGSFPIYCEADTRPNEKSLVTKGSVYDR